MVDEFQVWCWEREGWKLLFRNKEASTDGFDEPLLLIGPGREELEGNGWG